MDQGTALAEVGRRIVPILEEFGIEGFVMTGYIRCNDGKLERFSAACTTKDNAAINDGLAKVAAFSTMWAADATDLSKPAPP